MTRLASALYVGRVMHQRLRPRRHRLVYRIFTLLIDLDEIDERAAGLRFFSHNRANLFSFYDRDHGDGSALPLRTQIERQLDAADIDIAGGKIGLLAMPRLFGYVFNPLSIYFCYRRNGSLAAILYEINNTFGERHTYLVAVSDGSGGGTIRQRCAKRFFVSPFLDMAMTYAFRISPPGADLRVAITAGDQQAGPVLAAVFTGVRRELTDAALIRAFAAHPLLTFKVIAGIHWEALQIWLKGVGLRRRPRPPAHPVTFSSGVTTGPREE